MNKRPFARVMYASRLSLESGDDAFLREKYAWELLNTTSGQEYDKRQKKFILEFADRVFWVKGYGISEELKEAYKMQTISLEEYSRQVSEEAAKMEGKEEKAFEVARNMLARNMSVSDIIDLTGLDEDDILALG